MVKKDKFPLGMTAFRVRVIVFAGAMICLMLTGAAGSTQATSQPGNSQQNSAENEVSCDSKPAGTGNSVAARRTSYILGDSIGFGLQVIGFEAKLQARLGGASKISFDSGRAISVPGHQIKKSALESVDIDRAFISSADVIIIILGTNQLEGSFAQSQQQLMQKLKAVAPRANYYWVDIGATMSNQVAGWSARNKTIYENAKVLGYTVISRYKAIFGPSADPLRITPGQNFPNSTTEPGYGGEGNIHGAYGELSSVILEAVSSVRVASGGCTTRG